MKCPVCDCDLNRGKYAGANVMECADCRGALVATSRAAKIERRINKDLQQLAREHAANKTDDTRVAIRCPNCRSKMEKRAVEELSLQIDDCRNCGRSWFDGGELAALQLLFEQDPQTQELNQMRARLEAMSPAEREEYESRISKLRDDGSSFSQAVRGATFELSMRYYWWTL